MSCIISLIDNSKNKIVKSLTVDTNYKGAEERVEKLNKKLKNDNRLWVVTQIGKS